MQQVSKVLVEQNRKVKLLEIKLLVSSEMLFLCFNRVVACVFWRDPMLCLRYCFALCKINLFSVKPLWGFYFGIVRDDILAVIVSEKQYVFDCVVGENIRES